MVIGNPARSLSISWVQLALAGFANEGASPREHIVKLSHAGFFHYSFRARMERDVPRL